MCFAIVACGFVPRCALDESDSAMVRFEKILDLITACEFSVHDVSRVELDARSGLPRFSMPLELGADLGLHLKGPAAQRRRRILVLDAVAHRYDQTLSDISGMDIEAHGNDPARSTQRSPSAGIGALTSAIPGLHSVTLWLCLGVLIARHVGRAQSFY